MEVRRMAGVDLVVQQSIWFNPVKNIGFEYSVTVEGLTGDQNRMDPILVALMAAAKQPQLRSCESYE